MFRYFFNFFKYSFKAKLIFYLQRAAGNNKILIDFFKLKLLPQFLRYNVPK